MNTKARLKKWAAILVAAVVALSMLPAETLDVQASPLESPCSFFCKPDDMQDSDVTDDTICIECGWRKGLHVSSSGGGGSSSGGGGGGGASDSSGSDGEMDRKKSSEPPVPLKTPEQIAWERVIAEGEEHQAAIKQESEINKAVQVGGSVVRSTLPGAYTAKSVRGTAVRTPLVQAESDLGLSEGEKLNVTTWDVTVKNSPLAAASLESAAESVGGKAGPMFQVNIDKLVDGKPQTMSLLNGSVTMTVGVPAGVNTDGGTLAVAHVIAGGAYEVQRDQDNDPNTATFNASAGESAYALVTNPDEELLTQAESNTLAAQVIAEAFTTGSTSSRDIFSRTNAATLKEAWAEAKNNGIIIKQNAHKTKKQLISDQNASNIDYINSFSTDEKKYIGLLWDFKTDLDASVVNALMGRRNIEFDIFFFLEDGDLIVCNIPAGTDLTPYLNKKGGINYSTLVRNFDNSP